MAPSAIGVSWERFTKRIRPNGPTTGSKRPVEVELKAGTYELYRPVNRHREEDMESSTRTC